MSKKAKIVVAVCILLILNNSPASAGIVTIEVEGVVDRIRSEGDFGLDGSIDINSIMSGFCIYDTEALPEDFGHYFTYPVISISTTLGNYVFTHNPASPEDAFIRVGYDNGYIYDVRSLALVEGDIIIDGVPQPFDNDVGRSSLNPFMKLGIYSEDPDPGPPYNLPNPFPDFSAFDMYKEFTILIYPFESFSDYFEIHGEITSLTVIPEPGTVFLLGVGGLVLLRKKRTRA